jgi:hypothetical protein
MRRWVLAAALLAATSANAGTVARSTKSCTGTTAWPEGVTTCVLDGEELNDDFDLIFNEFNGNITNANINASAAIAQSKIVDPEPSEVDGYSDSVGETDDDESPGDYSSRTAATTLQKEIEQLRYTIARVAGLTGATRVNASGSQTVGWVERPANPYNLIRNASFTSEDSDVPKPWVVATSATPTLSDATDAEGFGLVWNIVVSADNRGYSYTLTELKASTRYAVVVRAAEVSGACDIATTGADATSEWRNLDLNLDGATYANYIGVIQTDGTPTNIVLQLFGDGGACEMNIRHVGVYELRSASFTTQPLVTGVNWGSDSSHTCAAGVPSEVGFNIPIHAPASGYLVRVHVDGAYESAGAGTLELEFIEASIGVISPNLDLQDGAATAERPFSLTRIINPGGAGALELDLQCTAAASAFTLTDMQLHAELIPLE